MGPPRLYPALFEHEGGQWGVTFPGLPGCVTVADSLEHALAMAREALGLHIEGMLEDSAGSDPRASAFPDAGDAIVDFEKRAARDPEWAAVLIMVQAP